MVTLHGVVRLGVSARGGLGRHMDIATAADGATVIAVITTPLAGFAWWWWTRRREKQRLQMIAQYLTETRRWHTEMSQPNVDILTAPNASDSAQIRALLMIFWTQLMHIQRTLEYEILLTHGTPSLMPDWKLQWPIAPKDTPK